MAVASQLLALALVTTAPVEAHDSAAPPLSQPRVGVSLEVGVPQGAGVELAFRPWSWVRISAGPAYNGAAAGVRGGLTVIPFQWPVRPTLSVSAGHFPEGDARGLMRLVGTAGFPGDQVLSRLQYDYASAQLGLEIGSARGASFTLRGGLSRVHVRLPGFEEAARDALADPALTASVPEADLLVPSLQLGLLVYFGG